MQEQPPETLRQALARAGSGSLAQMGDGIGHVALAQCLVRSCFANGAAALAGKSVLLATDNQFETALALIELDGVARRLVLLPPDVPQAHVPAILRDAAVEAIVASDPSRHAEFGLPVFVPKSGPENAAAPQPRSTASEWVLLTSGTTGDPKLAIHSLAGLTGAIPAPQPGAAPAVWATFYDIRRYGGLQIFLRAMFGGATLVLSRKDEALADHLARLAAAQVTHISGTPTHWRRMLMMQQAPAFAPAYIRLSGEIADQPVLDGLKAAFPRAGIGHAYASTEAGVGFDVNDGLEGFPASYLDAPRNGVELRIADGCLHLRSSRRATAYAGRPDLSIADAEGWVDSGDMVEVRDGRCYFMGRRSGIINVGGLKVHPEEVEAVVARHPSVRQVKVRSRKSPIIGSIVIADVVLREDADLETVKAGIIAFCADALPPHKVPALINIVPSIAMTPGGKVSRANA